MAAQLSGPEHAVRARHRSEKRLHDSWVPPAPHSASRLLKTGLTVKEEEARVMLGVGPAATAEDIREAFRRLALRHHPDRGKCNPLSERCAAAGRQQMLL
jgi:hypothetical protein